MLRQLRPSVRPSVCHTRVLSRCDRPIILAFRHQGSLRKSDGAEYKGVAIFDQNSDIISETVRDRGIVTMEDEYKVVRALSNSAVFDDLE